MTTIPEHVTPYLPAMREWVSDCVWRDMDDTDELTDLQVVTGVQRHYQGGVKQFITDAGPTPC